MTTWQSRPVTRLSFAELASETRLSVAKLASETPLSFLVRAGGDTVAPSGRRGRPSLKTDGGPTPALAQGDPVLLRMNQRLRAARENEGGFTLIELLIVIVILGVLTGIVVIGVGAFSDRGEAAACKSDRKIVEVALEAYRAKTGGYPSGADSDARYLLLTGNGYLKEKPNGGAAYTVTINDNSGTIGTTGAC